MTILTALLERVQFSLLIEAEAKELSLEILVCMTAIFMFNLN